MARKISKALADKIEALKYDAHPLREAVVADDSTVSGTRAVDGPGLDCYGKETTGRITYGEAVARYGAEVVHAAMDEAWVRLCLDGPHEQGAAFDPANARDDMRMYTNCVQIG